MILERTWRKVESRVAHFKYLFYAVGCSGAIWFHYTFPRCSIAAYYSFLQVVSTCSSPLRYVLFSCGWSVLVERCFFRCYVHDEWLREFHKIHNRLYPSNVCVRARGAHRYIERNIYGLNASYGYDIDIIIIIVVVVVASVAFALWSIFASWIMHQLLNYLQIIY